MEEEQKCSEYLFTDDNLGSGVNRQLSWKAELGLKQKVGNM